MKQILNIELNNIPRLKDGDDVIKAAVAEQLNDDAPTDDVHVIIIFWFKKSNKRERDMTRMSNKVLRWLEGSLYADTSQIASLDVSRVKGNKTASMQIKAYV